MNTHHFTHERRKYRLFKRTPDASSTYYLHFQIRGVRVLRSTGTTNKTTAVQWARTFLEARAQANTDALARLLARPGTVPTATVGQFLNWFESSPALGVAERTRIGYCNAFRLVLLKAGQPGDNMPTGDVLTKDTVFAYLEAVHIVAAGGTQTAAARVRRSAASILNQAKAVLSLLTVEHAQRAGLMLPPLAEFLGAVKIARKELAKGSAREDFRAPDDAVIAATLAAWRAHENPNVIAAIWLALSCGLRCGEIAQARWEWIAERNNAPLLDAAGARVKNGTGTLRVRPLDPFWSEGLARLTSGTGMILTGESPTAAANTFRAVSDLMRAAGWRTQKATHALRALAGSYVAKQFGIYEAQVWLRHASVTTTEQSYTSLLRGDTFRPMPVSWSSKLSSNNVLTESPA